MKNNLKDIRLIRNFTQVQLAEEVQVSRQTIISIETSRYIPSVVLAAKLAKVLGKKVEDLFEIEKSDFKTGN